MFKADKGSNSPYFSLKHLTLPITFEGEKSAEGYHVTEPGMDWTYTSGDGGEVLVARKANAISVNNDKESNVANDRYYIEGIAPGTVTVTGTPWDDTNGASPVTFTVTVTPDPEIQPVDHYQMALEDTEAAARWIRDNKKAGYFFGSEWEVFSLTRSGRPLTEEQIDSYLEAVEDTCREDSQSISKPTTLARVILALSALEQDASDFRGLDLISMLVNNSDVKNGSNEAAWTLIALDSRNYPIPEGAKWTRKALVEELLGYQGKDKGFSLFDSGSSSVDITGMALQALAPYDLAGDESVAEAVDGALDYLRGAMDPAGGYGSVESAAQVLTALTALNLDPLDKANGFVKGRKNLITNLHTFRSGDGFTFNGTVSGMSSVQALYSLESYIRFHDRENRLYDLTDLAPLVPESKTIRVSFTLVGAERTRAAADVGSGSNLARYQEWIAPVEVELPRDATVYDVFTRVLDEAGLEYRGAENNYIKSITAPAELGGYSLNELENGPFSGWMYQVNGEYPPMGFKNKVLKDGDRVKWHYANDYRYEGGMVQIQSVKLSAEELRPGEPAELPVKGLSTGDSTNIRLDLDGAENVPVRLPVDDLTPGTVVVLRDDLGNLDAVKYSVADEDGITFRMPASGDLMVLDWAKKFGDVTDQWYAPAAAYTSARGIFSGVGGDRFGAEIQMSRGMLATVLWSLAGKPEAPRSNFKDVDRREYYAPAVDWAAAEGIISGYGNGLFGAEDVLNREQLAVILYSWLDRPEVEQDLEFPDSGEISDWAVDGMKMAVSCGFMVGLNDGRLAPQVKVDRGQTAAVLMRFCEHQAA